MWHYDHTSSKRVKHFNNACQIIFQSNICSGVNKCYEVKSKGPPVLNENFSKLLGERQY